jgi:flagellar hook-associated protein 2
MASITGASGISSILGQYSGIGADQIDQLLQGDAIPKLRAQNRIEDIQKEKTAWSDIKTRLTNFLKKTEDLQKLDTFQTKKATSSDDKSVKISGTAAAGEGKYSVQVKQLATSSSLTGAKLATNDTSLLASGALTIKTAELDENGIAKEFTFDIDSLDSLKDIATKINKETKNSNITATIVDNRLVLEDKKTGDRTFTVEGNVKNALGLSETEATFTQGKDAEFVLNGIEIKRQSNTIDDVIEGVTFELLQQTEEGKNVSLTLTNDTSKIKTAVKDFVTQYNSLMSLISDKLKVGDPSSDNNTDAGALAGDSTLIRLQTDLRNMVAPPYTSGGGLKAGDLGISITDRQGTLALDEKKFDELLAKDPDAVKDFFFKSEKTGETTKTSGYSVALKEIADKYLSEKSDNKGVLATKFESYEASIKDLNKQITRLDTILEQKKARYVDMFTRLDQAMMQAEEQMSWLVSQVESFNGGK